MKKQNLLTLVIALLPILVLKAQNITYSIQQDDPYIVNGKFVAVEVMNAEFGGNKNTNTFSIGANSVYSISENFGVEGRINYAIAKDSDLPISFQFEGGGFKSFTEKTKKKDLKVRIGGEFKTEENRNVYNEEFIWVPSTNLNMHGVRGGLYYSKKGLKDMGIHEYSMLGIYGGWSLVQKTNLVAEIKGREDGKSVPKQPLYYSGFTRYYVDIILTPVTSIDVVDPSVYNRIFGVRTGVMFYKDGPKFLNKFMWGVETGVRPIDGFFFRALIGYSLYRG